jgi:hypothetical protein
MRLECENVSSSSLSLHTAGYTNNALADPTNNTSRDENVFHDGGMGFLHLVVALLDDVEGKEGNEEEAKQNLRYCTSTRILRDAHGSELSRIHPGNLHVMPERHLIDSCQQMASDDGLNATYYADATTSLTLSP